MRIRIKRMTFEDAIDKLGNLCLYAFLFLTSFIFLFRYNHSMFILRFAFLVVGALIGYLKCFTGKGELLCIILFALGMTVLWLLSYLAQDGYTNYSPTDFLYSICYLGISVLVLQSTYDHMVSLGIFVFTAFSILLQILRGVNYDAILLANSRNFISVLLLSSLLLYYISCHDKKKPILVTPVLLYFLISIYAKGRGGIIVSGLLSLGLLLYKYSRIGNKKLKGLLGLLIGIVIIVTVFYFLQTEKYVSISINEGFSAFKDRGIDSNGRREIWLTFLSNNKLGIIPFLFGSNASMTRADGNLHNSFLQSYASFGIVGFIALLILIIHAFFKGILFAGLLLRAFTDRVFFQGYCELYLYYFVFYHLYHRKISQNTGDCYAA